MSRGPNEFIQDLIRKYRVDFKNGHGSIAEFYQALTKFDCDEDSRRGIWRHFQEGDASNRSPLYLASLGREDGQVGWHELTLSLTDCYGTKLSNHVEVLLNQKESPEIRVSLKINGIHIMVIMERTSTDKYVKQRITGKQGNFDGLNVRNGAFGEVVTAMLDGLEFDIDAAFEERTGTPPKYLLFQFELACGKTGTSHKNVSKLVFEYSDTDVTSERETILGKLFLYPFRVSEYQPQVRTQSEKVQRLSFETQSRIFDILDPRFPRVPSVILNNHRMSDAERRALCKLYQDFGPNKSGEGFIVEPSEGASTKCKIVYSDTQAYLMEIPHGILPCLILPGSDCVNGLIVMSKTAVNTYAQHTYFEFTRFALPGHETGFGFDGSAKWTACHQLGKIASEATRLEFQVETRDRSRVIYSVKQDDMVYRFKVPAFMVNKGNYNIVFMDIRHCFGLSQVLAVACKCNQIVETATDEYFMDTAVFTGIIGSGCKYTFRDSLQLLQGSRKLTTGEKIEMQRPVIWAVDDIFNEDEVAEFFMRNLSIPRGPNRKMNMVRVTPYYRKVNEFDKKTREYVPRQRSVKTLGMTQVENYKLNGLTTAYLQFGSKCDTPAKLGYALKKIGFGTDCIQIANLLISSKTCMINQSPFSSKLKAKLTQIVNNSLTQMIAKSEEDPTLFDDPASSNSRAAVSAVAYDSGASVGVASSAGASVGAASSAGASVDANGADTAAPVADARSSMEDEDETQMPNSPILGAPSVLSAPMQRSIASSNFIPAAAAVTHRLASFGAEDLEVGDGTPFLSDLERPLKRQVIVLPEAAATVSAALPVAPIAPVAAASPAAPSTVPSPAIATAPQSPLTPTPWQTPVSSQNSTRLLQLELEQRECEAALAAAEVKAEKARLAVIQARARLANRDPS